MGKLKLSKITKQDQGYAALAVGRKAQVCPAPKPMPFSTMTHCLGKATSPMGLKKAFSIFRAALGYICEV
jgi:hypothetical protein